MDSTREKEKVVSQASERWVLIATILASSMVFIDSTALNVALPAIQVSLNASAEDLLWIINAYLLMLAALILVGGSLGDRLGRKKVFMVGISIFSVASLACGLSPSVHWLIAARTLQGLGGALMVPGSLALITASFPADTRGRAIGTWSATTTLVTVAGPLLGGLLADLGLWRGVFLINLPLGLASLLLLSAKVPESRDEDISGGIDFLGVLLVTIGLAGLTYGFVSAPNIGFSALQVWGAIAIGAIAIVGFILAEARNPNPMMPLKLFKSPTFSGTNLLTLFLYGALSANSFFLSLNLAQVQGYSKTQAGLSFLPFTFLLAGLSRWAGGLSDRTGARLPLVVGPAIAGLGFLALSFAGLTRGPVDYWTSFFPGMVLFGIGMGITVAPLTTAVMGSVPASNSGTASGINNAVSRIAGVLAIAIIGSVSLFVFSGQIARQSDSLSLSQPVRQALQQEAGRLGAATVPDNVDPQMAPQVDRAIKLAFTNTYRVVLLICAAMAWISAAAAGVLVSPRPEQGKKT